MQIIYNPLDIKYKSRTGAVMVNEEFTITVSFVDKINELYLVLKKDGESEVFYQMQISGQQGSVKLTITTSGLYFYHFYAKDWGMDFFADDMLYPSTQGNDWQLTCVPPKKEVYFNDGIIYQIFVDRFNIGGKQNRTKNYALYHDKWDETPVYKPDDKGIIQNNDFFGGNLQGIIQKLPYLKSLNVGCIYLNPIFEARSNHKYDTGNYLRIDSDFGTEKDLYELIEKGKEYGISVMLDGVFSHTGDDSLYFNKYGNYDSVGAYQSPDSPYYSWYNFISYPDDYHSWWGIKILPETNELDTHYKEFICGLEGVVAKYLRMGICGWRLDVADELPSEFLSSLTKRAKKTNENSIILGEVWEDASNKCAYSERRKYFTDNQLDSVTNYVLKDGIINFIITKNNYQLIKSVKSLINNYPKNVLDNLMNVLDTHDTQRIITIYGKFDKKATKEDRANAVIKNYDEATIKSRLSAVIQYFIFGVPCVYYGDEVGLYGFEDPFNRRTYPYGREDKQLLAFYQKIGKIRKENIDILKTGRTILMPTNSNILHFARENNGKRIDFIINLDNKEYDCNIIGKDLYNNTDSKGIVSPLSFLIIKKH